MASRILIAGETGNHCLEMSYFKAFCEAGYEVKLYDTKKAVQKHARLGKLGYRVHQFLPVDIWVKKANKEFTEEAKLFRPDILLVFTGAEILPGSFAYLKSIFPVKIIWYWADPLPNLTRYIHQSLSLADMVASYSRSSQEVFRQMGARSACWLPFAGDKDAHFSKATPREKYTYDICFIGSWRPEREEALKIIFQQFPRLRYKISGPYWNRCKFLPIRKLSSSKPVYGKLFAELVQDSFLNLNIIDKSNFPAANMRFFEIITAGGLELSSAAPEMKDTFFDRIHVLYFNNPEDLVEQVQYALNNKEEVEKIKIAGQQLLTENHLYSHRVKAFEDLAHSFNA